MVSITIKEDEAEEAGNNDDTTGYWWSGFAFKSIYSDMTISFYEPDNNGYPTKATVKNGGRYTGSYIIDCEWCEPYDSIMATLKRPVEWLDDLTMLHSDFIGPNDSEVGIILY